MQDYLAWPADDLDPYRLAAQTQVIPVVAMVGAKVGDEARRERQRNGAGAAAEDISGAPVSGDIVAAGTGENPDQGWGAKIWKSPRKTAGDFPEHRKTQKS